MYVDAPFNHFDTVDQQPDSPQDFIYTADKRKWRKLKGFAQHNRTTPTEAENVLWQALRGGKMGFRFRRQHTIGQFIVDFVCLPANLIVEVDGDVHSEASQTEYDTGRTYELEQLGYHVVRFSNEAVLNDLEQVLATLKTLLTPRRRGSPSPEGEGAGG